MKPCRKCGVEKPEAEYYADSSKPDGLGPHCKACHTVWRRARRRRERGGAPPVTYAGCENDAERAAWLELRYTPEPNTGCWLWLNQVNSDGYGMIYFGKYRKGYKAHRVFYEMFKGPIPDGIHVLHSCDTPTCVNPAHLSLGTHSDNHTECAMRGRSPRAKITPEQAVEMRRLYNSGGHTMKVLGLMYGLSTTAARAAIIGETWKRAS